MRHLIAKIGQLIMRAGFKLYVNNYNCGGKHDLYLDTIRELGKYDNPGTKLENAFVPNKHNRNVMKYYIFKLMYRDL